MNDKTALKLCLQFAKTSAQLQAQVNAKFRTEYGQSLARFDVLSQLDRGTGTGISVGELSQELLTSSGNITRLLDRMQNEGLLRRKPSPNDLRCVIVCITPKGATLFGKMAKDHEKWVSDLLGDYPKEQQRTLIDSLINLQASLQNDTVK